MAKTWEGLDLSHWNKITHMGTVKDAGYGFLILKAGGNESGAVKADKNFVARYNQAIKLGFKVGAYFFTNSKFLGKAAGEKAALQFLSLLEERPMTWGVWLDNETTANSQKAAATEAALAFVATMKRQYPYVGIYGSDISVFKDRYIIEQLAGIPKWVARYGTAPTYVPKRDLAIWQKTSTGYVPGVEGRVDVNTAYFDIEKESKK